MSGANGTQNKGSFTRPCTKVQTAITSQQRHAPADTECWRPPTESWQVNTLLRDAFGQDKQAIPDAVDVETDEISKKGEMTKRGK